MSPYIYILAQSAVNTSSPPAGTEHVTESKQDWRSRLTLIIEGMCELVTHHHPDATKVQCPENTNTKFSCGLCKMSSNVDTS